MLMGGGKTKIIMKNTFYFFSRNSEQCYIKRHFEDIMKDNDLSELEVFKAVRNTSYPFAFYCNMDREIYEREQGVCSDCGDYNPRNGICKHWRPTYEPSSEPTILKIKIR